MHASQIDHESHSDLPFESTSIVENFSSAAAKHLNHINLICMNTDDPNTRIYVQGSALRECRRNCPDRSKDVFDWSKSKTYRNPSKLSHNSDIAFSW